MRSPALGRGAGRVPVLGGTEDKARRLRDWMPGIVTGLLQTEDYARALLETYPGATGEAVNGRLAARMERQRRVLMRDDPPLVWFVVDEFALYRLVGSAEIMAAQMRQLSADRGHAERHAPGRSRHRAPRDGFRLRSG